MHNSVSCFVILLAGAWSLIGCSHANVPLNGSHMLLENRVKNQTRAAVFADVSTPTNGTAPSMLHGETAVRTAQQSVPVPPDQDGYFVGVALSGGGSRSANFAAACLLQLEA